VVLMIQGFFHVSLEPFGALILIIIY